VRGLVSVIVPTATKWFLFPKTGAVTVILRYAFPKQADQRRSYSGSASNIIAYFNFSSELKLTKLTSYYLALAGGTMPFIRRYSTI
jgi:hypothetical protein